MELATPRAGDIRALEGIRDDQRICVGVLNQKLQELEPVEAVEERIERAMDTFGADRVVFSTDCGFATFADNPIVAANLAEQQLALIVQARDNVMARRNA